LRRERWRNRVGAGGVAALHAAYFEEMAAHQEADPTEADESEFSAVDALATLVDAVPETRVTWRVISL
jgi:hypothetical protein